MTSQRLLRSVIKWLLLVTAVFCLITGFGITEFRTVETLTLGLLTKSWAFKIHNVLWVPFVVLLASHVLFTPISRLWRKR